MGWLTTDKVRIKLRAFIVRHCYNIIIYPYLYGSFWHYLFSRNKSEGTSTLYYTARPNPGAGIGHQMANWIAGYWYAKAFGVNYAYSPFPSKDWDEFLGFSIGEVSVIELIENGYEIKKLPLFRGWRKADLVMQKKIISSYSGRKVIFIAEQDQALRDQYMVINDIQKKFYDAPSREKDQLKYDNSHYNIAIHIRRGDIMVKPSSPQYSLRYLSNNYFYNVLKHVLSKLQTEKEIHIYLFSQGTPHDLKEFKEFKNLHWCLDMNAQQSFLHMVFADVLITSKSSFSYKPALLNRGIKVCPKDFWHGYPKEDDWILCDNEGHFLK